MKDLRQLLAALLAITLILSVASMANPNYFAGLNVYADDEEDDDKENEDNDEQDDHDEQDDEESEDEDDDDNKSGSNKNSNDDNEDETKLTNEIGEHSKVTLEADEEVELEIEIKGGDLADGEYDVLFECASPATNKEFSNSLTVEEGEGEFDTEFALSDGTYSDCKVTIDDLSASFASFGIRIEDEEDEENDDEDEKEEDDDNEQERYNGREEKSKLKVDRNGVELRVEVRGLDLADGSYDAIFACEDPSTPITLENAFEVKNGKGRLEQTIGLTGDSFIGCTISVEGSEIASFNTFTVSARTEQEHEHKIKDKREERKEHILSTITGLKIHEKHRKAAIASPGEYEPGWNYTLSAEGSAMGGNKNDMIGPVADASVDIDMAVWKSTRSVIVLDVTGGTINIGNQEYTVKIGYSIYSIQHNATKVAALAVDGDGNIVKLRLFGAATDDEPFPEKSGSVDLMFGGSINQFRGMQDGQLVLEGDIAAA